MTDILRIAYLVSFVGSSGSSLTLFAGCEFGEITMVITLPAREVISALLAQKPDIAIGINVHLMIKYFGLA